MPRSPANPQCGGSSTTVESRSRDQNSKTKIENFPVVWHIDVSFFTASSHPLLCRSLCFCLPLSFLSAMRRCGPLHELDRFPCAFFLPVFDPSPCPSPLHFPCVQGPFVLIALSGSACALCKPHSLVTVTVTVRYYQRKQKTSTDMKRSLALYAQNDTSEK